MDVLGFTYLMFAKMVRWALPWSQGPIFCFSDYTVDTQDSSSPLQVKSYSCYGSCPVVT